MIGGKTQKSFSNCGICGKEIRSDAHNYRLPIEQESTEYWQSYHPECVEREVSNR